MTNSCIDPGSRTDSVSTIEDDKTPDLDTGCDKCLISSVKICELVCVECLLQLCSSHITSHREDRFTEKHNLVTRCDPILMNASQTMQKHRQVLKYARTCMQHSREIADLLCIDCNQKVVCKTCLLSADHRGHEFILVANEVERAKNAIDSTVVDELVNCRTLLTSKQSKQIDSMTKLESYHKKELHHIKSAYTTTLEKIRTDYEKQVQDLNVAFVEFTSKHDENERQLHEQHNLLSRSILIASSSTMNSASILENPFETIKDSQEIVQTLKSTSAFLQDFVEFPLACDNFRIDWDPSYSGDYFEFTVVKWNWLDYLAALFGIDHLLTSFHNSSSSHENRKVFLI